MPIRLTDPTKPEVLDLGDGVRFHYTKAPADRVRDSYRRYTKRETGEIDSGRMAEGLVAEHVFEWEGVEDANGQPIPWPGRGKGYGREEQASPEEIGKRRDLLPYLPAGIVSRLEALVIALYREAQASGKG